ncbi:MAG: hypothetical protein V1878_07185 [bacterium]
MRGHNKDGSSSWSNPLSFTVPFPSPTLKSPGGAIFTRNPVFHWSKEARANSYRLQVSANKEFSTTILDISDLKDPTYALTTADLSYKGQYLWRVMAKDELGESSWSAPLSFTLQMPLPNLTEPIGVIFDPRPTFVWNVPKDATGTRLQVSNREDFVVLLLDKPNLQGNTYNMEQDLAYEGVYFWRVKALFPEGESDWSPISRFVINYKIPDPLSPKEREEAKTLTPTFTWKRATGAVEYAIQIAKDSGFAKPSVEARPVKGESYTSPRLEAGFTYFWRVKGIFSNKGESDWSKSFSFAIPQQPLPIIANSLQITDDKDSNEMEPVFTPDGKRLLYVVEKKGLKEIWCKEVSTREGKYQFAKGTSRITWSVSGCQDRHPSPFPDNLHVAYTSNRLRDIDNIWSKSLSGHILTELTCTSEGSYNPAVSPDGKKIAYVAKNVDGVEYVWVMNADGTGYTQFYEGREPAWTPDGQRIIFVSRRAGKSELWLMEKDGLNLSRLTISTGGEEYMQPSLSPDGKTVAFICNKNGNWDIWIMNLDGSGMQHLTTYLGEDINPTWAPDGKAILYGSTRNADDLNLWLDYLPSEIVESGK